MNASQESGGWFKAYSDEVILENQRLLASREGVFCEPASAVSIAGAIDAIRDGRIPRGSSVVCTVTGHGIKDPDTAIANNDMEPIRVSAEADAVRRAILDQL